jgi:hypothetical protein
MGVGEPVNYPQDRHDTTIQIADNVAWTVGRNQFKIGADFHRLRLDNYLDFLALGEWLFLGCVATQSPTCAPPPGIDLPTLALTELLAGVPDAAIGVTGNTINSLRSHGVSSYIQDDIHVVPRFLLNVGLRYEYNTPPVEALNRFSVPDLTANSATYAGSRLPVHSSGNQRNPQSHVLPEQDRFRPAPRLGMASVEDGAVGRPLGLRHLLGFVDCEYQHLPADQSSVL